MYDMDEVFYSSCLIYTEWLSDVDHTHIDDNNIDIIERMK